MSKDNRPVGYVAQRMEQERANLSQSLAQRILSSVNKSFLGEQTLAWLKNVDENVSKMPGATAQTGAPQGVLTSVAIMDKLFDDFERYAFHFNQTEPDRNYVVTCIRPAAGGQKETSGRYQGYLHNSFWSIHLVAEPQSVSGKLFAARFVYEDESRRPQTYPFFEMAAADLHGSLIWRVNDRPVSYGDLASLSKLLFARLTRVSRGEVSESEALFSKAQQPPEPLQPDRQLIPAGEPVHQQDMIGNALITLIEAIDGDLAELDRAGLQALKKHGVHGVTQIVSQVEALRAFREKAGVLAMEWANTLANQGRT